MSVYGLRTNTFKIVSLDGSPLNVMSAEALLVTAERIETLFPPLSTNVKQIVSVTKTLANAPAEKFSVALPPTVVVIAFTIVVIPVGPVGPVTVESAPEYPVYHV